MNLSEYEKGHKFYLYCHECGGYAYKAPLAREHMMETHGKDAEFVNVWWSDEAFGE